MFEKLKEIIIDSDVKELGDIEVVRGEVLARDEKPLEDRESIIDALKLVFDPEISIDIYNLGLIYNIDLKENGDVDIDMSLTSPTCPMAEEIPLWAADSVATLEGVGVVKVKVVWEPAWDLSRLSEEAKFQMEITDLDFSFLDEASDKS